MSNERPANERPEFRPIELAPVRRAWPYALVGAALVGILVWVGHRSTANAEPRAATLGNLAPATESKLAEAKQPEARQEARQPDVKQAGAATTAAATAKPAAPEGPNVLGGAMAAAGRLAMVARSELDRELGRTQAAQRQAATWRKQAEDLQRQLTDARAQIASLQRARQPPPASDQEQILQMLAPVLRTSNDGHP